MVVVAKVGWVIEKNVVSWMRNKKRASLKTLRMRAEREGGKNQAGRRTKGSNIDASGATGVDVGIMTTGGTGV